MREMVIDGRRIGPENPPYIIAELSANHNGVLEKALETIEVAARCGADALKLQTYTPDTMTIDCDAEDFQITGGLWDGYKLYDLYQWAQTPFEWQKPMFEKARSVGVTVFSTPFDETAVDLLEDLNAPAYKIASFEAVDLPLIRYVAQTGKPMIISTGMADLNEIAEAVAAAQDGGCSELALLHCVSGYPTPVEQSNLRTIPGLGNRFDVIPGLSDHSLGTAAAVAAISLGACIIEKHFTLNRADHGPDSEFSIEPDELERLCSDARDVWAALGEVSFDRKPVENASMKFRRSLYFVRDRKRGETIQPNDIRRIRPGYGLLPKHFDEVVGRCLKSDVTRGTAVTWRVFE